MDYLLMAGEGGMKLIAPTWQKNRAKLEKEGFVHIGTLALDEDYFTKQDGRGIGNRDIINRIVHSLKNT